MQKVMRYLLLISMFIAPFFAQAQNYTGNKEDIEAILKKVKQFSVDLVNNDAEAIAAAYTDDGKLFPTGKEIMEGQDLILKYWTRTDTAYRVTYHKLTPLEISVMDDTAYDYGYYEGTTTQANGEKTHWKGKYVLIWKKIDGDWKIYLDIWNNIKS